MAEEGERRWTRRPTMYLFLARWKKGRDESDGWLTCIGSAGTRRRREGSRSRRRKKKSMQSVIGEAKTMWMPVEDWRLDWRRGKKNAMKKNTRTRKKKRSREANEPSSNL